MNAMERLMERMERRHLAGIMGRRLPAGLRYLSDFWVLHKEMKPAQRRFLRLLTMLKFQQK